MGGGGGMNHPITPPPELIGQWLKGFYGPETMPGMAPGEMVMHVAAIAARWGADQELEACCEYITGPGKWRLAELRAARRPKPPSLAEEGQRILVENGSTLDGRVELDPEDVATIRAALERLKELEKGND